jgi:uncharacterized membrane protein YjgN (DUF898 family)
MNTTTLFVDEHDEARITCTECGRIKRTRVAKFKHLHRPLKVKCACGHTFTVSLDLDEWDTGSSEWGSGMESSGELSTSATLSTTEIVQTEAAEGLTHQLTFQGSAWDLSLIYLVNVLMHFLTMGFHQFWGRVKVRRYMMSQTELDGSPFEFIGNGKELLLGWLKATLMLFIPVFVLQAFSKLLGAGTVLEGVGALLTLGVMFTIVPLVMVHGRRYRLSRTLWRDIPFSFHGPVVDFFKVFFPGVLLTLVTFGLYYPVFTTKRYAFMMSHSYYGNTPFSFDGKGKDLLKSFIVSYLLLVPTMGLSWLWFVAAKQRYFWERTCIAEARFSSAVAGSTLLVLYLGHVLVLIATMGLGRAWVKIRQARFAADHLSITGPLPLQDPSQFVPESHASEQDQTGFFALLDMDLDLG